jgi:hypothetical protein
LGVVAFKLLWLVRKPRAAEVAMRRLPFKTLLALGAACLSAGVLPSCATNDSMMFITGVYFRKFGACTPKADFDAPILSKGTLDLSFASEYRAALIVGNQITERGSRERVRTETSRVSLKGAEIQLENLAGASLSKSFSSTGTGFVNASEGTDPSLTIFYASLIPASEAIKLKVGTVVAKVRVFGTTLGGEDVESGELAFPIDVCRGCLVSFPSSARDLTADGPDFQCKLAAADMVAAATADADQPCDLGIDIQAPCTACSGLYAECQSPKDNCFYTDSACP